MQTAFFLISGILERETAFKMIKSAIEKSYQSKGQEIVEMNWKAVDKTNEALREIEIPTTLSGKYSAMRKLIPDNADEFTKNVIEPIMREKGDDIKVSQMPYDGFVPSATSRLEKRGVAPFVPHWIMENCIQCNQCSMVCPHAAIRPKLIAPEDLKNAPETFKTISAMGKDKDSYQYKIQVYPEDCQGCGVCVNECPKAALEMKPIDEERAAGESHNAEFFDALPSDVMGSNADTTVKGSQFKQPLLEFSGACAGCGETPYVKLITQLYGDRMIIANATGCSSIWGGTFPTIPYCKNNAGHGPAWANSLFEDNAEYGLGMKLAVESNRKQLKTAIQKILADFTSDEFEAMKKEAEEKGGEMLKAYQIVSEFGEALQYAHENWKNTDKEAKDNVQKIKDMLPQILQFCVNEDRKKVLLKIQELQNYFIQKSVWAFGGDGWAYDIGYGGLDHVLASGKNINIFVMDTEVYSNTGGQASKASPLGAVAKFAESGKNTIKKDLGLMTMTYGYIYVASISMGANKVQALKAIQEAEAYDGPSLIIAYAPCINHGIDMSKTQLEEKKAVESGYWLLYRYNPQLEAEGKNPLILDSREPKLSVQEFLEGERRYTSLERTFPEKVENFRNEFGKYVKKRYDYYKKLSEL
jgi:pyruvate-ferredoxin/flavodoxin oxidoreductase